MDIGWRGQALSLVFPSLWLDQAPLPYVSPSEGRQQSTQLPWTAQAD